jgi:hypothetical protein
MISALEDKDAIREVLAEYCFCLDGGRFAEMAALFAPDGTWHTAFGKATGRADIEALANRVANRAGPRPRGAHLVTNIVIKLAGDRASCRAPTGRWRRTARTGPIIVSSGGAYADEMVKLDGQWLFQYRKIDRFIAALKPVRPRRLSLGADSGRCSPGSGRLWGDPDHSSRLVRGQSRSRFRRK